MGINWQRAGSYTGGLTPMIPGASNGQAGGANNLQIGQNGGSAAPPTPEEQAAAQAEADRLAAFGYQAQAKVAEGGDNLGTYGWRGSAGYNPIESNSLRPDQTNAERIDQQVANYQYGGYAGGAADAAAAARGAVAPASQALGAYGNRFMSQQELGSTAYNNMLNAQAGAAGALMNYANQGPGASLAQAAHDANTAQAMRQQVALAGGGRGAGGGASAMRGAMANQAMIQGQANAQTAEIAAQEEDMWRQRQLQAYGQAGGLYGQGAGTAAGYAQDFGGMATDAQRGGGELALGGETLANQINTGALQGSMGYEGNLTDIYSINKGIGKPPDDPSTLDTILGVAQVAAPLVDAFRSDDKSSDERSKQKIADLEDELATAYRAMGGQGAITGGERQQLDQAFSKPGAYSYEYKNPAAPGAGAGRFAGPMAHELEGIPGVVKETPGGKVVDTPRLTMANTSEVANLRREVDELKAQTTAMGPSKPKAKKAAAVDTSQAPKQQGVASALQAFGSKAPNDAEIASAREALRGKYGSAAASEFERYAMALKKEKTGPSVTIGEAENIQPAGPTTQTAGRKGRNIPMRNLDEPSTGSPRAPLGTQFSDELSQEEQDEIIRQFYDPPENYRTYRL